MEITSKKHSSGFPWTPMHRLAELKLLILGNGRDFSSVAWGNTSRIFSSADQCSLLQMWLRIDTTRLDLVPLCLLSLLCAVNQPIWLCWHSELLLDPPRSTFCCSSAVLLGPTSCTESSLLEALLLEQLQESFSRGKYLSVESHRALLDPSLLLNMKIMGKREKKQEK